MRSPGAMMDRARQRLAALRAGVVRRRDAAHRALVRGIWSSRLSAFAFAGVALLPLLQALDTPARPADRPQKTARVAAPAVQPATHVPAAATAPSKPQDSLSGWLLDPPSRPREPVAKPPASPGTWQVVPTRRMDLTGHVVDSSDPVAPARVASSSRGASADKDRRDGTRIAADTAKAAAAKDASANAAPAAKTSPADKDTHTAKDAKPLPVPPASAPSEQQADAWTDAEVAEARAECARLITGLTLDGDEAAPVRNGACGTPAPVTLKRAGGAMTELSPPALVNCRFAVKLNDWINNTLQPAAQSVYGQPVVRIMTASSYTCRNRYGQQQAPISEHAFANALDMSGFVLRDGRVVKVVEGWGPTARDAAAAAQQQAAAKQDSKAGDAKAQQVKAETAGSTKISQTKPKDGKLERKAKPGSAQAATVADSQGGSSETNATAGTGGKDSTFLHKLHQGACGPFGTVLGPEANEAHRDHIHIDLKQRRAAAICE